jgi:hypothetical protein
LPAPRCSTSSTRPGRLELTQVVVQGLPRKPEPDRQPRSRIGPLGERLEQTQPRPADYCLHSLALTDNCNGTHLTTYPVSGVVKAKSLRVAL